jgi:hypothetical protein
MTQTKLQKLSLTLGPTCQVHLFFPIVPPHPVALFPNGWIRHGRMAMAARVAHWGGGT